ncbi:hypothetical protein TrVGV298_005847 [Trichoderma virens]|nr:hypothetical protein TrVGV298_005847 [Trichoderma virens]
MRLPYVADPPPTQTEQDAAIVQRIQDRRAPRPLQALDLTLLHSPHVADGWNSFLGAVRTKTSLSDDVRELAISRVAVCNKAWYEWGHHAPLAIQGGVGVAAMEHVKEDSLGGEARGTVEDETFALLKQHFNDQEVVEITATVAAYNCVSRFLVALDVGEKNGTGPDAVLSAH